SSRRLLAGVTGLRGSGLSLINPRMGLIGNLGHEGQVVSTKAGRILPLPLLLIAIEPGNGHIVAHAIFSLIDPNGGPDSANADFMHRPFLVGTLTVGTRLL